MPNTIERPPPLLQPSNETALRLVSEAEAAVERVCQGIESAAKDLDAITWPALQELAQAAHEKLVRLRDFDLALDPRLHDEDLIRLMRIIATTCIDCRRGGMP